MEQQKPKFSFSTCQKDNYPLELTPVSVQVSTESIGWLSLTKSTLFTKLHIALQLGGPQFSSDIR